MLFGAHHVSSVLESLDKTIMMTIVNFDDPDEPTAPMRVTTLHDNNDTNHYFVTNTLEFAWKVEEYYQGVNEVNEHFPDKIYLAQVAFEQALKDYQVEKMPQN